MNQPYYQSILCTWQTKTVDADDLQENITPVSSKITLNNVPKWVVTLETEWPEPLQFSDVLAQEWIDKGVVAGREDPEQLETKLKQTLAQLLIGVRTRTVPNRDTLRQISHLAEAMDSGVITQLLNQDSSSEGLDTKLGYQHSALAERNVVWLEPTRPAREKWQSVIRQIDRRPPEDWCLDFRRPYILLKIHLNKVRSDILDDAWTQLHGV